MTVTISPVTNTQSFGTWLQRTNDIVYIIGANAVTADSTTTGSVTAGNTYVSGYFGANNLYVNNHIAGGTMNYPNTLYVTSNLNVVNSTAFFGNATANVVLGYLSTPSAIMEAFGNQNNYVQVVIQNANNQTSASADIAIYNDVGSTTNTYVDLGITSSNWSNTQWTINGPSDGYLYSGNNNFSIGSQGQGYINFFSNGTLATNEIMRLTSGANVGIGNTNPNARLQVTGTANVSGNVYLGGTLQVANTIAVSGNATLSNTIAVTGNAIFSNSMSIAGNTVIANTIAVTGNAIFSNSMSIAGNTTIANTFAVTGNTSISNTIAVTGNAIFSNTMAITGATTIANNANVAGTLGVIGAFSVTNTVSVGNTTITGFVNVSSSANIAGGLAVTGNTVIANTIAVTGNAIFSNTMAITGNTVISNTLSVSGNTVISNTLNVTGLVTVNNLNSTVANATNINVSNSLSISTNFIANSSVVNSASFTIGNLATSANGFLANSSYIALGNNSVNTYITANGITTNTVNTYIMNVFGLFIATNTALGNILPPIGYNNTYSIGNSSLYYANAYIGSTFTDYLSGYGGVLAVNSNTTFTGITNLSGNVGVTGLLTISNINSQYSNTFTFSSTAQITVDSFSTSSFRSAEYLIQLTDTATASYQLTKILVVHDGIAAYATEFGTIVSNTSLCTFAVDINGGNTRLRGTPSVSTIVAKFTRNTVVV